MSSIPGDLMHRFREANDQFHQARLRLDDLGAMTLEQRQEAASVLRAAEREVEAITDEISKLLSDGTPPNTRPPAQ